ncbi:hypothetical protein [Jeotgalibacillus sp. JSM ZJ347]|uniref:hypothetical protein n=1 Tax=Jeotgalibacillus sp. JSM ZJ347 TaxID=3342117 RepID=UPI0035A94B7E
MKTNRLLYIFYWLIIRIGVLSFASPIFREYGIVDTIITTFICGLVSFLIASALLILSPWIFLILKRIVS